MPAFTSFRVAAGPQSNIRYSSPTFTAKADPQRSGVGVGVPAPRMNTWATIGPPCRRAASRLKGSFVLQAADEGAGVIEERPALIGRDRVPGNEPLLQRIHVLSLARHAVVKVGTGGEPGRSDVADHLALLHPRPAADARGQAGKVVVHGLVTLGVAELHGDAVAAVPARARHHAVGHGAYRRAHR